MNQKDYEKNMDELESLKQQFIVDSFVYNTNKTKKYVTQVLKHCKITSEGRVIIENKNLQKIDTIALIILARYLANKLEGNINESITLKELYKMTRVSESSVRGHVSTLYDRNFIIKPNDGVYQFNPSKIDDYLEKINSEYMIEDNGIIINHKIPSTRREDNSGLEEFEELSLREFVHSTRANSHTENTLAIAFYLLRYENITRFNYKQILVEFDRSMYEKPKNIRDIMNKMIQRRLLKETEPIDKLKGYKLTITGVNYVEKLLASSKTS